MENVLELQQDMSDFMLCETNKEVMRSLAFYYIGIYANFPELREVLEEKR